MTAIAIIVPTIGRPELARCLASRQPQLMRGERVMVVCDEPTKYNFAAGITSEMRGRTDSVGDVTWRCYPTHGRLGAYGHPARNQMLDLLSALDFGPKWAWSCDDDDEPTFGALDFIRSAIESGNAPWYVFAMRGGATSHFPGIVVPTQGPSIRPGNVGTPMLVFPVCTARFGVGPLEASALPRAAEPGYFGDYMLAVALQRELGAPEWLPQVVAEIRP